MEAAALLGGVISAAALVASLLFLARQTHEAARQTRLANQIAVSQVLATFYGENNRVLAYFLEYPELRRYFYEAAELDGDALAIGSPTHVRVLTLAELFADLLENFLDAVGTVEPAAGYRDDLMEYATFLHGKSPILRQMLSEHPTWFPKLAGEFGRLPGAHGPDVRSVRTSSIG